MAGGHKFRLKNRTSATVKQAQENLLVSAGKGQFRQLLRCEPATFRPGNVRRVIRVEAICVQLNPVARDGMPHGMEGRKIGTAFGLCDLNIRKFPKVCVHNARRPLAYEKSRTFFRDECSEAPMRDRRTRRQSRKVLDAPFAQRDTMRRHRASIAARLLRSANQRAQFHQRLVEM